MDSSLHFNFYAASSLGAFHLPVQTIIRRELNMKSTFTNAEEYAQALVIAERLFNDSKLLAEQERVKSAIILGVLAIEELGKALIWRWGAKNLASNREFPTHVEKQAAVFALLSADELLGKNKRRLRARIDRGDFNLNKEGGYCEQLAWARSGFYDDLRMAATFSDKEPKIPADIIARFDSPAIKSLHDFYTEALKRIDRERSMELAAEIYRNNLGRL